MKLYHALRNVGQFRTVFDFGEREVAHWFPGHMAKGDNFDFSYLQSISNCAFLINACECKASIPVCKISHWSHNCCNNSFT